MKILEKNSFNKEILKVKSMDNKILSNNKNDSNLSNKISSKKSNLKIYYGLTNIDQVFSFVEDVIIKLKDEGEDIRYTRELMIGTIAQETRLGTYKDLTPYKHGAGLCQIDPGIPFDDIKQRAGKWRKIVKKEFGIDLNEVTHRELELSPLLSIVMARVKYKLISTAIPETLKGQASYYKKWYNSMEGKATEEEYIRNYKWGIKNYKEWLNRIK